MLKKIVVFSVLIIIVIQFFQVPQNKGIRETKDFIFNYFVAPDTIKNMLNIACMDCHSDNTTYPWYAYVQPIGWWLKSHIDNGKKGLNFSEFGKYSIKEQKRKLGAITTYIFDKQMPLPSFLIIHKKARLKEDQRELIMNWADSCIEGLYNKKAIDTTKNPI
ncbi:MAG: heme-binding domain-containing protein [Chitinophagaceae bacterium]